MNSKEAFEEIIKVCNLYHRQIANVDVDSIHGYPIKKIEKDLEILDILKNESDSKRIIERDGIVSFHLDMILTADNYNKIKEWLENDS